MDKDTAVTQTLILRTNEEPTFFNKEAVIGFLAVPPLGAIVGGMIGKNRMEKEKTNGKIVSEPSAFNKNALLGGLLGWAVGGLVASIAITPALATGTLSLAALGVTAASVFAVAALGATIGGKQGKAVQEKEYMLAVAQQREQQIEKTPSVAKSTTHEYGHEVKTNHAATIQAEKAAAQYQQRHV
jgi:hypothetical protein